ncbi:hypothetical protein BDP55DRAFT_187015 [Colletotrichum godetiae]|uniref:Uncharacterized protein n=1 Tax=Colletotrichum godetiae TaxID=1209918 RepID=A0AAJ0AID4_9PEZI|nr:uncharacterized protein BDP55DRAFT_187015 [Colletotrichum godetiae]KAK1674449.1 hypothetical protein BDP55DRAFT_187015 [Colletotrichum godetiae]
MSHQTQTKPSLRVTEIQKHIRALSDPSHYLRANPVRKSIPCGGSVSTPRSGATRPANRGTTGEGGTPRIARGERIAGADTSKSHGAGAWSRRGDYWEGRRKCEISKAAEVDHLAGRESRDGVVDDGSGVVTVWLTHLQFETSTCCTLPTLQFGCTSLALASLSGSMTECRPHTMGRARQLDCLTVVGSSSVDALPWPCPSHSDSSLCFSIAPKAITSRLSRAWKSGAGGSPALRDDARFAAITPLKVWGRGNFWTDRGFTLCSALWFANSSVLSQVLFTLTDQCLARPGWSLARGVACRLVYVPSFVGRVARRYGRGCVCGRGMQLPTPICRMATHE